MLRRSWTEHKVNEEVLKTVDTRRELMDSLRIRQKRWLGHVLRQDDCQGRREEGDHGKCYRADY